MRDWKSRNSFTLALVLAVFTHLSCFNAALALEGQVNLDVIDTGSAIEDSDGEGGKLHPPLEARIETSPPTWIKGKVFSNDEMTMYSFYQIKPFKKEWRWEIPEKRTKLKMRPRILKHWTGYKPDGDCEVTCEPMGPGKFRFRSQRADGPHGYLERTGVNDQGYPRYRFWFDDETSESESKKSPQPEEVVVPSSQAQGN